MLSIISSKDCGEGMSWPPVGGDNSDGGLESVEESSGVIAIAAIADVPLVVPSVTVDGENQSG